LCCLGTKVPKGLVVRPMESFAFMQGFFDFITFYFFNFSLSQSNKIYSNFTRLKAY